MPTAVQLLAPPSDPEVLRGARKLARFPGVWRIAVFGSVSRGDAHAESDIDYLVICNTIDYSTRNDLALRMQVVAATETDHPVQVVLSDTAEWEARTALPSTFEAHIENEATDIVLVDPSPQAPNQQVITMATPVEQATDRLQHMASSLDAMQTQVAGYRPEQRMISTGQLELAELTRESRWMTTLQQAEMALEHGLMALVHTTGGKFKRRPRHRLAEFRDALAIGAIRAQAAELLNPLRVVELPIPGDPPRHTEQEEFTVFRIVSDYGPQTVHDSYITPERVLLYMNAAIAIGELALRETTVLEVPAHYTATSQLALHHFESSLSDITNFMVNYDALGPTAPPSPDLVIEF